MAGSTPDAAAIAAAWDPELLQLLLVSGDEYLQLEATAARLRRHGLGDGHSLEGCVI